MKSHPQALSASLLAAIRFIAEYGMSAADVALIYDTYCLLE